MMFLFIHLRVAKRIPFEQKNIKSKLRFVWYCVFEIHFWEVEMELGYEMLHIYCEWVELHFAIVFIPALHLSAMIFGNRQNPMFVQLTSSQFYLGKIYVIFLVNSCRNWLGWGWMVFVLGLHKHLNFWFFEIKCQWWSRSFLYANIHTIQHLHSPLSPQWFLKCKC